MAVNHVIFNPQSPHGAALRAALTKLEEGWTELQQHRDAMVQMQDGGEFTSHGVGLYGFETDEVMMSAFNEISSTLGKLNTTGGDTTDHVRDALIQLFARFR